LFSAEAAENKKLHSAKQSGFSLSSSQRLRKKKKNFAYLATLRWMMASNWRSFLKSCVFGLLSS